jgi:DNA-dependent protein kinase catalytic subunit
MHLFFFSSPTSFQTVRQTFMASHAAACAVHYLLGIGDRHLSNTMVNTRTGRVLSIDFGHAFGICARKKYNFKYCL